MSAQSSFFLGKDQAGIQECAEAVERKMGINADSIKFDLNLG
jgi:hypothetical protein